MPRPKPQLEGLGVCGVITVAVVALDPAWRPLPAAVYTAWMSQPCCSSCMNGTFTSYAAVRMMPAGQVAQQPGGAAAERGAGRYGGRIFGGMGRG
jgi:hypothetical protein